jgi:hypothetical protein
MKSGQLFENGFFGTECDEKQILLKVQLSINLHQREASNPRSPLT